MTIRPRPSRQACPDGIPAMSQSVLLAPLTLSAQSGLTSMTASGISPNISGAYRASTRLPGSANGRY